MLEFNEERHEYKNNGVIIPSVTQIIQTAGLSDFSGVNLDLLQRSMDFGKAVHKVIELTFKGTLDHSSVDCELGGHLWAWDKFVKDYSYKISSVEFRAVNTLLNVGYCIDSVGVIETESVLVDIKTGNPKPADIIQVSAYGKLYPSKRLLIVYLGEHEYKVVEIGRNDRRRAEMIFLSCLNIYNFKKEKGLL